MRAKNSSVNIAEVEHYLRDKNDDLDGLWKKYGADELVVTSGKDGQHSRKSLHYVGRAEDLRLWNLPPMNIQRLKLFLTELEGILPDVPFDVIMEWAPIHIHAEYDPHPIEEKIALRRESKVELQEYAVLELGKIDTDVGILHKIITSDAFKIGEKVVKIGANIIGEKYAGIKVFEIKESSGKRTILDVLNELFSVLLDKIRRR